MLGLHGFCCTGEQEHERCVRRAQGCDSCDSNEFMIFSCQSMRAVFRAARITLRKLVSYKTLANRGKKLWAPVQVEINEASLHTNGSREIVTNL